MTTKYFDNRAIVIDYNNNSVFITDKYNDFMFKMDSNMKKYFVPYIERLSKICGLFGKGHIPTHLHPDGGNGFEIMCNEISNCYRENYIFYGNYMDMDRKNKIISAFRECFKRVKEEDIELLDVDLKRFDLKSLLLIKKGLL